MINAYAADRQGADLKPFTYDPGPLGPDQVEIQVSHCGICHSDLSVLNNEWGNAVYPLVPGHEVAGTIVAVGDRVTHRAVGQTVGLGWFAGSCMGCASCLDGDHNLCAKNEQTIIGRHGGFADKVRCHWAWAVPLPASLDPVHAGPLFCGGITVFNPIVQFGIKPTDKVGVIGIGGLGHMALQFLNKWGCEVTAFTSTPAKADEAKGFGAHHVVSSKDDAQLEALAWSLDFILVTSNVTLNWPLLINALKPKGRLHVVGAVLQPMMIPAFSLLMGQRSVSASPLGSPATTASMLDFCVRHDIAPRIETYPMSRVNEAMKHLEAGKARYRIVLQADF